MSVVQLCPTLYHPMDLAHQASLSVELSRQEYWSGFLVPSPGDLHDPGLLLCRQILYLLIYQGSLVKKNVLIVA